MNAPSEDIKDMLEENSSLGLIFASNLFIGREPAEPANCVTIFDTPGSPPLLTLQGKGGIEYSFPSIQIRVRDTSYLNGWELIKDIEDVLHGIHGETYNGTTYDLIQTYSGPFLLDWDERNRVRFVITFHIQRK